MLLGRRKLMNTEQLRVCKDNLRQLKKIYSEHKNLSAVT